MHTARVANKKNKTSLFQNTNAVARHKSASWDLGSSDQSNMTVILYSAIKRVTVSGPPSGQANQGIRYSSARRARTLNFVNWQSPIGARNSQILARSNEVELEEITQ